MWSSTPSKASVDSELKEKFELVVPELVKTITEIEYFKEIPQVKEFFEKVCYS